MMMLELLSVVAVTCFCGGLAGGCVLIKLSIAHHERMRELHSRQKKFSDEVVNLVQEVEAKRALDAQRLDEVVMLYLVMAKKLSKIDKKLDRRKLSSSMTAHSGLSSTSSHGTSEDKDADM